MDFLRSFASKLVDTFLNFFMYFIGSVVMMIGVMSLVTGKFPPPFKEMKQQFEQARTAIQEITRMRSRMAQGSGQLPPAIGEKVTPRIQPQQIPMAAATTGAVNNIRPPLSQQSGVDQSMENMNAEDLYYDQSLTAEHQTAAQLLEENKKIRDALRAELDFIKSQIMQAKFDIAELRKVCQPVAANDKKTGAN